ncbi:MAG TPA: response regulator, partial [Candidatus Paceibacterota bacterium]
IQILNKETFDLILLDLVMPKLDGFAVLQWLKGKGIKTPVIVTSNLSQDVDAKRSKELGAVDYFIKSDIPIAEVVERVKKVLKI